MRRLAPLLRLAALLPIAAPAHAQSIRVDLAKQPFSPTGTSAGPATMASGGIMDSLVKIGAIVRIDESKLTAAQDTEYGTWKRLGWALGDFARIVARNERDGFFTVGLLRDLSVDARHGRRIAAFRGRQSSATHRHAVARRASGLQHARDHAQR